MFEPFKISRVLPTHELNARRVRKRILFSPPPIFNRPVAKPTFHEPAISPNDHVYNHGAQSITHHQ